MGNRLGHTSCYRGKKVFIRLRNGESFEDRFLERTCKHVILYGRGKIRKSDIDSFSILKKQPKRTA